MPLHIRPGSRFSRVGIALRMADDFDIPDFKPVDQRWQLEYSRIRKLGGGDYWEGRKLEDKAARSKMSPYALGVADHRSLREATEMHNPRPPIACPFAAGTPEKAEYDRGWNAPPEPSR
jgi:hypothetical protein